MLEQRRAEGDLRYTYEQPSRNRPRVDQFADFTCKRFVYWETCGMMAVPVCRPLVKKVGVYRKQGSPNGSCDNPVDGLHSSPKRLKGGIDSKKIFDLIRRCVR